MGGRRERERVRAREGERGRESEEERVEESESDLARQRVKYGVRG